MNMNTDLKQPKNRNVFFVGLLSFFGGISQDIFTPILPIYLTTILGFSKTFVGTAEGIVAASATLFAVVAGYFSDKYRRQKPIVFAGYFLSMLARPLLAFLTSGAAILGLRLTDGIGKGIKDPPKDVLIAGSSAKEVRGKSFGIARMLDTLGSVAGPLILFVLLYFLKSSTYVYHYILLFAAVPLIITLFVLVRHIKEIPKPQKEINIQQKKPEGRIPRSFYIFLFIAVIFTIGNSSDAFLILRARGVGFSIIALPIVIALFNLVYAGAAVPFGALSDKIGRIPTMLIGWFVYAITYVGFALAIHPTIIWFLYVLYGIYFAANLGVAKAFLADLVGWEFRGRAFGIYGMAVGIATFIASFIAGFFWDKFGAPVTFYFGAGMAAFAAILLIAFSKKLRPAQEAL
jgi:MFS family permease